MVAVTPIEDQTSDDRVWWEKLVDERTLIIGAVLDLATQLVAAGAIPPGVLTVLGFAGRWLTKPNHTEAGQRRRRRRAAARRRRDDVAGIPHR